MSKLEVVVCSYRTEASLMLEMHRLRYRVFKARLDWEVAVSGNMEIDTYDISNPVYLGLVDAQRNLLGGARMLPTTGPNMLANTFPMLLHGQPAPCDRSIWECSRLCIDTERAEAVGKGGLRRATHALVVGIAEWSNQNGITELAAVTDLTIERILRRAGCTVERLGEPMMIGKAKSVACMIEISDQAVARMRAIGDLADEPVLVTNERDLVRRRA